MQPSTDVVVELKRYHESCSSDKAVNELVQQCEGTQPVVYSSSTEVVDKAVCEPGDSKDTASSPISDISGVAVSALSLSNVYAVFFMAGS
jgi:hypothetical protein